MEKGGVIAFTVFRALAGRVFDETKSLLFQLNQHFAIKLVNVSPIFGAKREVMMLTDSAPDMRNRPQFRSSLYDTYLMWRFQIPTFPVLPIRVASVELITQITEDRAIK